MDGKKKKSERKKTRMHCDIITCRLIMITSAHKRSFAIEIIFFCLLPLTSIQSIVFFFVFTANEYFWNVIIILCIRIYFDVLFCFVFILACSFAAHTLYMSTYWYAHESVLFIYLLNAIFLCFTYCIPNCVCGCFLGYYCCY